MIVNRTPQKITSPYGKRKGFKRSHKGIDLRTYTDDFKEKLEIVLPEDCIFIREVFQDKWGWTYVFKPLDSPFFEIKFTHMGNTHLKIGEDYKKGDLLGYTLVTDYMRSKRYGDHLHFETWGYGKKLIGKGKKPVPINPVFYLDIMGIDFV